MINLCGSRLTDVLPASMDSPEMRAFSAALGKQIDALCKYVDAARVCADIDGLPDVVLDAMAADLRTPAYLGSYSIGTKRALIKGTLLFYMQMGTPAAIQRIIEQICGNGTVAEWFDYGGSPYHFRVATKQNRVDVNSAQQLISAIESVKRETAVLDAATICVTPETITFYLGCASRTAKLFSVTTDAPGLDYTIYADENGAELYDECGLLLIAE